MTSSWCIALPKKSCFYVLFAITAIPLTLILAVITLPWKMYILLTRKAYKQSEIQVNILGPSKPKDDLLFIHGWPDCGNLWVD